MPEQLQPNGNPVRVGSVTLRTPGLAGVANSYPPSAPGVRGIEGSTDAFVRALASEGVQTQETIEIAQPRELPVGGGVRTRSTAFDEPAIEVEVPDPGENWGQVLLAADESGVVTWNFARDERGAQDVTRGRATRTYVIRRHVPGAAGPAATRGLVGAVGKKVFKVLVFPLVDPVIGAVGDYFAARWEAAKRPYGIRSFTPDDYASPGGDPLAASDWQTLSAGRSLLLLHGTFSRAHTAFNGLSKEVVEELHKRYEGRVFAFDHFTVSADPLANVQWLLQQMPSATALDLDIVCHSRGGLVSRVMSEMQARLALAGRGLNVNRVVFVATPNAGTILSDAEHLGSLVDSYTNILNFFPDNGVTETLETIMTVVKQLAVAALKGMEGLTSMAPQGKFLTDLNKSPGSTAKYHALAANYEPVVSGFKDYVKDVFFDKLFGADNDLVVPTDGVFAANGSAQFPIQERLVFPGSAGVQHSGFFASEAAQAKLLEWLQP